MSIVFSLVKSGEDQWVTVFAPGRDPLPASSSHPNFHAIVAACVASTQGEDVDVDEVADLFDIAATITRKFERLSTRVTVDGDTVLFDGDPAQPGLSKQILRFLDEGEDVEPLVNFMEKIENNPSAHSKQQAWAWLDHHDFTITENGDVIGYKGVESDGNGGYQSLHAGTAFVNDEKIVGKIPNDIGDVVTMPRSEVRDDPQAACSHGLHVGTYSFASTWASRGVMLKVLVDPRDIVSVPHDAHGEKIRVCRYVVLDIITAEVTTALDRVEDDDELTFEVGERVTDEDGDEGTIVSGVDEDGDVEIEYDDDAYGVAYARASGVTRIHGKGGPTSQAAKGNGLNPAQDPKTGQFVNGRPGSRRDTTTGRFS